MDIEKKEEPSRKSVLRKMIQWCVWGGVLILFGLVMMEASYQYRQFTPRGKFLNNILDASGHINFSEVYISEDPGWLDRILRYSLRRFAFLVHDIDLSFLQLKYLSFERFQVLKDDYPFSLELAYTNIRDEQLADLSRMQNIWLLNLTGCSNLTENGLRTLKNMRGMEYLYLSKTACTDAICEKLGSLPIEQIMLGNTAVTGTCFWPEFGWRELRCISLVDCKIDSSFFSRVVDLPHITEIYVSEYEGLLHDMLPLKQWGEDRHSLYIEILKDGELDDRYRELESKRLHIDGTNIAGKPEVFRHPFVASRGISIPIHGWGPILK
jgi:hypothetical protein